MIIFVVLLLFSIGCQKAVDVTPDVAPETDELDIDEVDQIEQDLGVDDLDNLEEDLGDIDW